MIKFKFYQVIGSFNYFDKVAIILVRFSLYSFYMLANAQTKKMYVCKFKKIIIFVASFAGQAVINKDPSVWQDGARPASTCIPPSFLGNGNAQLFGISTKKVCL
jgi:hypothetical protein